MFEQDFGRNEGMEGLNLFALEMAIKDLDLGALNELFSPIVIHSGKPSSSNSTITATITTTTTTEQKPWQ